MNGNTGGSGRRGRSPLRLGVQAAAVAAVALLAAACGGGSGGGGSSSGGHSTAYQKELAYSECMRANGEPNFPDPGSNGVIAIQVGGAAAKGSGDHRTIGGPQMQRAGSKCRHLLPNGGVPTAAQRQQLLKRGLKFAECMRAHGISNFPDPSAGGGPTTVGGSGINIQSPQFQAANRACSKDLRGPGGGGIRIAS
jgi:hypothetical protein